MCVPTLIFYTPKKPPRCIPGAYHKAPVAVAPKPLAEQQCTSCCSPGGEAAEQQCTSCAQCLGTATPAVPAPKGEKGGVSGLWSRLTPQTGEPYALKRCPVWTHFYKQRTSFRPFTPVQP